MIISFFPPTFRLSRIFSLHKLFTAEMVVKREFEPAGACQSLRHLLPPTTTASYAWCNRPGRPVHLNTPPECKLKKPHTHIHTHTRYRRVLILQ